MSTVQLLSSELTNLISQTKRRNVELRQSSESSLEELKAYEHGSDEHLFLSNLDSSFITPFLIACSTRNAKYSATAIHCLHALINAEALPKDRLSEVLEAFREATHLGVEIQLKILQSLPSLIQYYGKYMQGELIVDLLMICYILQGPNKIPAVVNTAAATLQQLIISIFDKVVKEDADLSAPKTFEVPIDNGDKILISPAAFDALRILYDLCNLIEHQKPVFIRFAHLQETFGLELIESILTNQSEIFQQHMEFGHVLRTRTVPLLLRAYSEKRDFPVTMRVARILYLLIRRQLAIVQVECEVILSLLTHMIEPESAPYWKRVLSMEVFQGVCSEFSLILTIYNEYDANEGRRPILKGWVNTLDKISGERPELIGISSHPSLLPDLSSMNSASPGRPITPASPGRTSSPASTTVSSATIVAAAAGSSLSASPATSVIDLEYQRQSFENLHGISTRTSQVRVPCIDLLDKTEPPHIPETYLYYLILTCINSLSDGLARFVLSAYDSQQRKSSVSSSTAVNVSVGYSDDKLATVSSLIVECWPELLSCYTTFFYASLDSDLYHTLVRSVQKFAHASGGLMLIGPRDAYLSLLAKFAVLTAPSGNNNGFGTRNILCFRALINLAIALGPGLGPSWTIILETLQYVDYLLLRPRQRRSENNSEPIRLFAQLGPEFISLENSLRKLLEATKDYSEQSFEELLKAIGGLSELTIGVKKLTDISSSSESPLAIAGIGEISKGDRFFLLDLMADISCKSVSRYLSNSPSSSFNYIVSFTIGIASSPKAPPDARLRAGSVLNELLRKTSLECTDSSKNDAAKFNKSQRRIMEAILEGVNALQIKLEHQSSETADSLVTSVEIHISAVENLNVILDQCGSVLVDSWDVVFDIIDSVFIWNGVVNLTKRSVSDRSTRLIKAGFETLQLICNDFLSSLPDPCLIRLIDSLYRFCRQEGDLNISFTAISFYWTVSDYLRSLVHETTASVDVDFEITSKDQLFQQVDSDHYATKIYCLWIIALLRLCSIAQDDRAQVRNGAIQILFRTFEAHGANLPRRVWTACQDIVLQTVMDIPSFDQRLVSDEIYVSERVETLGLILSGLGGLYTSFVSIFLSQPAFSEWWTRCFSYFSLLLDAKLPDLSLPVYTSIGEILKSFSSSKKRLPPQSLQMTWDFWTDQTQAVESFLISEITNPKACQDALTALVALHEPLTLLSDSISEENNVKILKLLGECAVFDVLPLYYSDHDHMSPLQAAALNRIEAVMKERNYNSRLIIELLSSFIGLSFNADRRGIPESKGFKRPTFVSLCDHSIQLLNAALQNAPNISVFSSTEPDTILTALESLLIPMEAKFVCPPTNIKFQDRTSLQLWQLATVVFYNVTKLIVDQKVIISNDIWLALSRGIVAVISTQSISSWKDPISHNFELFDIEYYRLLILLFYPNQITPDNLSPSFYPSSTFGDSLISSLYDFSFLYSVEGRQLRTDPNYALKLGSTGVLRPLPRQQVAYLCVDELLRISLLVLSSDNEVIVKVAENSCQHLIKRVSIVLLQYIRDQPLRGRMPMPSVQRKELLHLMNKLLELSVVERHAAPLKSLSPLLAGSIPVAFNDRPVLTLLERLFLKVS